MEDVSIVCVAVLVSEEYSITHYRLKDCLELSQNEEATSDHHQFDFGFLWIAGCTILVTLQTQHIADRKICGFERKASGIHGKTFRIQSFRFQSSHFRFRIQNLLLCVNGKTNPVLKRSGFITNPEQFPLV